MDNIQVRDIKWHSKNRQISQVPKEGLEIALLSRNYEQIHQLVWCKDFMQDAIFGHINKRLVEIYGFRYDPSTSPPVYLNRTRLMVTNYKDAEFSTKMKDCVIPLLHSVEDRLNMPRTVLEKCKAPPVIYRRAGVWILDGSRRWQKSPPMISLYTLLIRIGLVHNPADSLEQTLEKISNGTVQPYYETKGREKDIVNRTLKGISVIMKHNDRHLFSADIRANYPAMMSQAQTSLYTIHNSSGICAFSEQRTKSFFPDWHKHEALPVPATNTFTLNTTNTLA